MPDTLYTLVAPWAPTAAATSLPCFDTTSTVSASSRALASISRVVGDTVAVLDASANTQILETPCSVSLSSLGVRSDDLELGQEVDDLLEALAVVLDDRAGLALLGLGDLDDLLAGAGPTDRSGVDAEVGETFTSSTGFDLAAMIPLNEG